MRPLPLDTISQTLSASRSELQPVLREVANLEGPAYALKQAIFKEVSVNEWPSYTEHERKLVLTNMSKGAFPALWRSFHWLNFWFSRRCL